MNKLTINSGETIDLTPYVRTSSEDVMYDILSDDITIAIVAGTELRAVSVGSTKVNVYNKSGRGDSMNIVVCDAPATEIELTYDGNLQQTTDRLTAVRFYAEHDNYLADAKYSWFINDERTSGANSMEFIPNSVGDYEVTVKSEDLIAKHVVSVYAAWHEPEICHIDSHSCSQMGGNLRGRVEAITHEGDPLNTFEWQLDGKTILYERGDSSILDYPIVSVGRHTLVVMLNGKICGTAEFITHGAPVINGLTVDVDSGYPDAYVRWQTSDRINVSIDIDGNRYDSINNAELFEDGCMRISCPFDIMSNHDIVLRTLSDEVYTQTVGITYSFSAFSAEQAKFLSYGYIGGNRYITSDDEFIDIYSYVMYFRPEVSYEKYRGEYYDKSVMTVYMAYESQYTVKQLAAIAWTSAGKTGRYLNKEYAVDRYVTFEVVFLSDDAPSKSANGKAVPSLIRPNVSKSGCENAVKIDENPIDFTVSTSDQLYYVISKGYSPKLAADSAAKQLYTVASDVLCSIIDEGMTDVERIRAIADFIMFTNTYEQSVTNLGIEECVKQNAFYLEGVLTDGRAVCDGIAKTFSLMCNMAGIPCIRIVGKVTSEGGGGHAWNKVYCEGKWYIVDCTWNDSLIRIGNYTYEKSSHKYFLVTDKDVERSHMEMYSEIYPKTSEERFIYTDYLDYGTSGYFAYNYQLSASENEQLVKKQSEIIAQYIATHLNGNYYFLGEEYQSRYIAFEFAYDSHYAEIITTVQSPIVKALAKKFILPDRYEFVLDKGNMIIVLRC